MACSHCSFCGINLSNGLKRRLYSPIPGRKFILQRCKATPFLYPLLTTGTIDPDRKQHLCIPCVNWKRRAEHGRLKRSLSSLKKVLRIKTSSPACAREQTAKKRCL